MDHLGEPHSLIRRLTPLLILAAALLILGAGIARTKVAATISDPVDKYRSQDESLFANSAITMVLEGDWLTPKFLGRIYLFKPPLQLWVSALSMKLLGISLFALRLPMLIGGALGVVLVYSWCRASVSTGAGIVAAMLLVSDPMWHIFSRLFYTDLLLALFTAAALYFVFRDPRLERPTSVWGFGVFTAAAIMTKNVAGVIPILTLLLFAAVIQREQRPRVIRILYACLVGIALAAPWHLYQGVVHPQWFWADYVQTQLLAYGVHPPAQISSELPLVYYAKRLFLVDPVLLLLALAAIPGLWIAARRRDRAQPILLATWLLVICVALSVFQVRGQFRWVLFLLPPLCMLAAGFAPVRPKWLIAILCIAFAIKAAAPAKTWGLTFGANPPMPAENWLRAYADRGRPNPLVLVDTDDELYSATLPLAAIHYCWIDPSGLVQRLAPHYVELGITVTAAQFDDMARWEPAFRQRLREWGLNSDQPIATAVVAESDADIPKMIAAHPFADFYLPARFRPAAGDGAASTHDVQIVSNERFFLLARRPPETALPRPKLRLPSNW